MEDNKTIAEMNTEADDKLIAWSLQMIREHRVDFSKFDLLGWCQQGLDFPYEAEDGMRFLIGSRHVATLLKTGSDDEYYFGVHHRSLYSDSVMHAMAAYSRKRKRNRCALVMYGLLLYVLRPTKAEWDADDFLHFSIRFVKNTPDLKDGLFPALLAEARGLLQGRDPLAEVKDYPSEFIVEQLKAQLPDSTVELINTYCA